MDSQRVELGAFILYPILASMIGFLFQVNGLFSIFLFYGPPALYLCVIRPAYVKKAAIFSLAVGVPFMAVISYVSHLNEAWYVKSLFPYIGGYMVIEDVVWAVFWIFYTVLFYEWFIRHRVEHKLWHPHMKYFLLLLAGIISVFAFALLAFSPLLDIPYFYLCMGIVAILLPALYEFATHERVFITFTATGVYFFYFHLIYEVSGLKLGWWSFPGTEFIGRVSLLGVSFPLEELFFWIMLGGIAVLSYYELFDDSQRA